MSITATGLGSGIDVASIVKAIVNAQKQPKIAIYDSTQELITSKISSIGSIKNKLDSFKTAIDKLTENESFNALQKSFEDSTNGQYFSTEMSTLAASGIYEVEVLELASKTRIEGAKKSKTAKFNGQIQGNIGGRSFQKNFGNARRTQSQWVNTINSYAKSQNLAFTASLITEGRSQKIIVEADENGVDFSFVGSRGLTNLLGNSYQTKTEGKIGQMSVDGTIHESNNDIYKGTIHGVTLTATALSMNNPATLKIDIVDNTDSIVKNFNKFVEGYNQVISDIYQNSSYNSKNKKNGLMQGDPMLRSIASKLRNSMTERLDSSNQLTYKGTSDTYGLFDFGVEIDRYGKMSIDEDKLREQLQSNNKTIDNFFTESTNGLATRLTAMTSSWIETAGLIPERENLYDNQIRRLEDKKLDFGLKMDQLEARLFKQFSKMDSIIGQLNQQSSFLQQRLASLPGLVRK